MSFEPSSFIKYWPAYIEHSASILGLVIDAHGTVLHGNQICLKKLQGFVDKEKLSMVMFTGYGQPLVLSDLLNEKKLVRNQINLYVQNNGYCSRFGESWEVSLTDVDGEKLLVAIGAEEDSGTSLKNKSPGNNEKEVLHHTYQKLAEKIPGFVFQFKKEETGKCTFPYISSSFNRIFEEGVAGLKENAEFVLKLIHRDDRLEFDESISQSAQKLSFWRHTFRFVCGKGVVKWVQGIGSPERVGDAVIWRGFIYDVSDKMNFEQRLKKQQADLDEIAFLQAHEFRRPVANMLSLFDMIELHCRDVEAMDNLSELLNMLKKSVKEADEVIAKIVSKTNNSKWLIAEREV